METHDNTSGINMEKESQPNLSYLKELSGGDTNFVVEIIEMFMADAPQIIEQANGYFQEENYDLLKVTVHKLKSSVQVLGNAQLALSIQDIESSAKNPDKTEELPHMLAQLEVKIGIMMSSLTQELGPLKDSLN